jgi:hypothetical protein
MTLTKRTFIYEQDRQFGSAVLTLLRHRGSYLSISTHYTLVSLATTPRSIGSSNMQDAVKELLNLHPILAQSVSSANMQALCFLPIYRWVAENGKNDILPLRDLMLEVKAEWTKERTGVLENTLRVLNISYALRDELAEVELRSLATFWQNDNHDLFWKNTYTLDKYQLHTWCQATTRLGLMYEYLTSIGIKEQTPRGVPSWNIRWGQCIADALNAMATEQVTQCIKHWASSSLSPVYILRASRNADINSWLNPEIHSLLSPLLPKSEVIKWKMLPWSQKTNSTHEASASYQSKNQEIARLYCPDASKLLDVVTTPEMWCNRKIINEWMTKFLKHTSSIDDVENASQLFELS